MGVEAAQAREIVRLARAQNGAITATQLSAAGLTRDAVRARVDRGRLVRLFRGVYALGDPALMPLARESGAVLSLGDGAVLSHRSAAAIWGLAEPDPQLIDVTVAGASPRQRAGVRLHRVRKLGPRDTATHRNLRVTSPARTLIDFAAQASLTELGDAFGEARARRLLTDAALTGALRRAPRNHPGAATVRATLREGGTYDRSKAERLMRGLCRRAQLPQPLVNVMLHGHLVDFLWPDRRLIVEVDGFGTHGGRRAFESDRRRDQVHAAAGYVVVRVTWEQLQCEPLAVLARIAQALAQRAA
jgi:very-short-patch-repair endonuclease/predicted transcriptional regulator of viral defense system